MNNEVSRKEGALSITPTLSNTLVCVPISFSENDRQKSMPLYDIDCTDCQKLIVYLIPIALSHVLTYPYRTLGT